MKTQHLLLAALLSAAPCAVAQSTPVRLVPPAAEPGAFAGSGRQSVAVGYGRIVLGAPADRNRSGIRAGAVHVFDETTGRLLHTLHAPDGADSDQFGYSVAISGSRIAVGAPGCDRPTEPDAGAVYVFDLRTRSFIEKLGAGYFLAGENAGSAVAMEGDLVAIGAENANFGRGPNSGAVVLWKTGGVAAETVITDPAGATGDLFGYSVALHGGVLAVGSPKSDLPGGLANVGSVLLFDSTSHIHYATVRLSSPAAGDGLGFAVALDRSTLYASTPNAAGGSGRLASWDLLVLHGPMRLREVTGSAGERLGASLSASQGLVAAGTPTRASAATGLLVGGVRVFTRHLDATMPAIQPASLATMDGFGNCVSLHGGTLVAGAPGDDRRSTDGGAVWKIGGILRPAEAVLSAFSHLTGTSTSIPGTAHSRVAQSTGTGVEAISITTLSGSGASGGRSQALWSPFNPGGRLALVAQTGVPDFAGIRFTSFQSVVANEAGSSLFVRATRSGPGISTGNRSGIFRSSTGSPALTPLLTAGMTMRDGEHISSIQQLRVNNAFDSTAITVTLRSGTGIIPVSARSDSGLVITSGGSVAAMLREGVAMSPLGTPYGHMPAHFSVSGDRMFGVFTAQTGSAGVTTANNSFVTQNLVAVARKGDMAPGEFGHPLGTFRSFTAATGSHIGIVFRGVMNTGGGITSANNEGLWTNRDHTLRMVLRKGYPAPGLPAGVTVRRFLRHGMNTSGSILMLVQVGGSGVSAANDLVLYLNRFTPGGSSFEILLREGQVVPGTGGAKLGRITNVDFTAIPTFSNSHYAAQATLATQAGLVTPANNLVWIAGNAATASMDGPAVRRPQVVLRKGLRFYSGTGHVALSSFAPGVRIGGTDGTLNNGSGHALGINFGRSTLKVQFSDRRQAVASMDL